METVSMAKIDAKSCTQTASGILRERRRTPGCSQSVSGCLYPRYSLGDRDEFKSVGEQAKG